MEAIYYVLAVFIAFYIPGNLLTRSFKLSPIIKTSSSILLGVSMWALQGFILGYLNLRALTYVYLLITGLIWLSFNYQVLLKPKVTKLNKKTLKENVIIITIFVIGVTLQILSVIGNAIPIKNGLYFCCGGADAIYHAALSKELVSNFPPNEPGIANLALHNYHYMSNLVIAELVRIFNLPLLHTEFIFTPIFMSIMFGLILLSVAKLLNISKNFIIFFLILGFFFSDAFYFLTLITKHVLVFDFGTIEVSQSLWISYTRYFGIVLFFQCLTFLLIWLRKKQFKYLIPLLIVGGTLIGFKVYIGILFLSGIGCLSIYFLFKKDIKSFLSIATIFILSALIYLPVNNSSGGFIFTGFWRTRDFIVNPSLGLSHLELARNIFQATGNPKRYIFDILFFTIYILFSLGVLITGLFNSPKSLKKIPIEIHIFLTSSLAISFILGMFFVQKTGGANSGQFLISIYIVGIFYSAFFLNSFWERKKLLAKIVVIALILLMLPKTINIISSKIETLAKRNTNILTNQALETFKFMNNNVPANSSITVDISLSNICLFIPIMTSSKPLYCTQGSPEDRGINSKKYSQNILKSKYTLVPKNKKNQSNQKTIYENGELKILKND